MNADESVTGPVNLGNPGEFSINELAKLVIAETGAKSELTFRDLPEDDPLQRCPDITLAREALSWAPTVTLAKGLKKTVAYFRDNVAA